MSVFSASLHHRHRRHLYSATVFFRFAHWKPQKPASSTLPLPPRPSSKPVPFTFHEETWIDNHSWMSDLRDKVAMMHMDVYMEQEEKYIEAVMMDSEKLKSKLQVEMASRMAPDLYTVPILWGPWLYYKRMEQGKQYPVLCRRLASLNEEFVSYSSPSVGFDFATGKKIEQKPLDYNKEAERFGGFLFIFGADFLVKISTFQ